MRLPKKFLLGCLVLGSLLALLTLPATTRQAVNFQVTTQRIPLVIKGMGFLVRDYEYRELAARLTQNLAAEETKAETLFRWTRAHIQPVPPGYPVVDDHISHIVIRGYGEEDQRADVFTCLSSYAGIPSFWSVLRPGPEAGLEEKLILSFCLIEGCWTVWDVARGIAFRERDGSLASVERLAKDPRLVSFNVEGLNHQGRLYADYLLKGLPHFYVPGFTRSQKQMPWPRFLFEVRYLCSRLWSGQRREEFDPKVIFEN